MLDTEVDISLSCFTFIGEVSEELIFSCKRVLYFTLPLTTGFIPANPRILAATRLLVLLVLSAAYNS